MVVTPDPYNMVRATAKKGQRPTWIAKRLFTIYRHSRVQGSFDKSDARSALYLWGDIYLYPRMAKYKGVPFFAIYLQKIPYISVSSVLVQSTWCGLFTTVLLIVQYKMRWKLQWIWHKPCKMSCRCPYVRATDRRSTNGRSRTISGWYYCTALLLYVVLPYLLKYIRLLCCRLKWRRRAQTHLRGAGGLATETPVQSVDIAVGEHWYIQWVEHHVIATTDRNG